MVGFTASWAHGNAVVAEEPPVNDGGLFYFNRKGWGTVIQMRPGFSRWFHIPIPTPVWLDSRRLMLIRAFIQWRQAGGYPRSIYFSDVHLYDGQNMVAALSNRDFKDHPDVVLDGHTTFELFRPMFWQFGASLSFHLSALPYLDAHFIDNRDAPVIVIGAAGADFDVPP